MDCDNYYENLNYLSFSPDGKLLVCIDSFGNITLWDVASRRLKVSITINPGDSSNEGAAEAAFSPDGKLLATADADGYVMLWDTANGQEIGSPIPTEATGLVGIGVSQVMFSQNGRLLISVDDDGHVQPWEINSFTDPYAALCAQLGPPTAAEWTHYAPGEPQPSTCVEKG